MFKTSASYGGGGGVGGSQVTAGPITSPSRGSGPGGWEPTILYMLGLVVAEIVVVGFLSRHLLK